MAILTAWLVKRSILAKTPADDALVLYLLVTMASMFGGAVIYLLAPSVTSLVEAVGINTIFMMGGIIFVLRYWEPPSPFLLASEVSRDEETEVAEPAPSSRSGTFDTGSKASLGETEKQHTIVSRAAVIALVLLNEFLMGWTFVLASGSTVITTGSFSQVAISTFDTVVGSQWFIFTMVAEMALSAYLLRNDLPRNFLVIILSQSIVMFFAPTAINNPSWVPASVALGSAAMIALLIYMYEYLFKNRMITRTIRGYFVALLTAYALMMAGIFIWMVQGSALLFVLSILGEMVLYFSLIFTRSNTNSSKTRSWMSDPWWVFTFMAMTFIAEFFMGALIDIVYYGKGFLSGISLAPIAGSIPTQIGAIFYDFISYFGTVTGSSWFLIMMGAEMGALVVFKIRITRELETKIRLVLVIVAYFIYSIFLPSFVFSSNVAKIPFLGWSMGVGTAGAVAPVFLGAILGTYLITGSLSFLFGARQTCSLFCTAALMYQGTFPDSMKEFNRTSKFGKKLLTSRMSSLYKIVATLAIVSMIIAATISYLNSVGIINFTFFGTDVSYFLYVFYFNFLWYIIFISIPFVGTYGCVTTGMCHIGLFNQFVSRFGLFKLKVKDPQQCVSCATKDCAKACPVGLTDLPGSFISSGQFRSHKCIGVGDCVSACPYQNEYFYDVRTWLREKIGRGKNETQLPRLPVIGNIGGSASFQIRSGTDELKDSSHP